MVSLTTASLVLSPNSYTLALAISSIGLPVSNPNLPVFSMSHIFSISLLTSLAACALEVCAILLTFGVLVIGFVYLLVVAGSSVCVWLLSFSWHLLVLCFVLKFSS